LWGGVETALRTRHRFVQPNITSGKSKCEAKVGANEGWGVALVNKRKIKRTKGGLGKQRLSHPRE